jgi:Glycosyltransferase 61
MFSLRSFYIRRLKPIPAIRRVKDSVWESVWHVKWKVVVPLIRLTIPSSARLIASTAISLDLDKLRRIVLTRKIPLISLSSFQDTRRGNVVPLKAPEYVAMRIPMTYPRESQFKVAFSGEGFEFPDIKLFQIDCAQVSGRSNLIVTRDGMLHHGLYRFSHDFTSEELHGKIKIFPHKSAVKILARRNIKHQLVTGAMFADSCGFNYAHWLTEVLPRINLFCRANNDPRVQLIVDAGLHPNIESSLSAVSGNLHPIVRLEDGESAEVERLFVVSPTGYIPFERRLGPVDGHLHGTFSPHAFACLRERLAGVLNPSVKPLPTKFFLQRKSGMRKILNEHEVESALVQRGFTVVEPEQLTFSEQYHLFSRAEIVAGATGAAFANLIFCRPHTKLVICLADHPHMIYGYWQAMAAAVGCQVTYVSCAIQGSSLMGIHSDFSVNIPDLVEAVS